MIRRLIIATCLLALPSVAFAQETNATGIGQAVSGSRSNSRSLAVSQGSSAGAAITFNNVIPANTTNSTSTRLSGTQRVIAAPSVFAPGLAAAGIETCLGSVSGGVSFPGGGVSFGSTTKDTGCDARLDSRTLWAFGLKAEAIARLCMKEETRAALGPRCPQPQGVQTVAYAAPVQTRQGIELTEGRTGRVRWCNVYDEAARRCRQWAN